MDQVTLFIFIIIVIYIVFVWSNKSIDYIPTLFIIHGHSLPTYFVFGYKRFV